MLCHRNTFGVSIRKEVIAMKTKLAMHDALAVIMSTLLAIFVAFPQLPIGTALADGTERGPEAPAIENEFAEAGEGDYQTYTVSFRPNGGSGSNYSIETETGTVSLPTPESIGFAPPDGAQFVGWSTDSAGKTNVYSQEALFPDNAAHTATLNRDTTLYAIWLPSGQVQSGTTAYFYIREDGTIPFEPSQGKQSLYLPKASGTALSGTLRHPVAITNNPDMVVSNLREVPSDEMIASVLSQGGMQYSPDTQKIVWYVIKSRSSGAAGTWNVDGIIVPKDDYMVYYNPNGGDSNVPSAKAYLEGSSVKVDFSTLPTRPGYDFLGWADSPEATVPDYRASDAPAFDMPASDKHLYAVWAERQVPIDYSALPQEGGQVSESTNDVRAYDGFGITGSTASPAKGYVFDGWYKDSLLVSSEPALSVNDVMASANRDAGAFANTSYVARFLPVDADIIASKAIANAPANGEYFTEGEKVEFVIDIANAGNVDLFDVSVNDSLKGKIEVGVVGMGQSHQVKYSYEITALDAEKGYVENIAVISASAVDGVGNAVDVDDAVVGAGALCGKVPPENTYVLFGVYPPGSGNVGRDYDVVDANTADGLSSRTAVSEPGYTFDGWYENGMLVSTEKELTVEEMKDIMSNGGTRAAYEPALFIAHFTADEDNPGTDPDNPDNPGVPSVPDNPGTDTPDTPSDEPNVPDEPSGAEPEQSANNQNTGMTDKTHVPYKPSSSAMAPTGDSMFGVVASIALVGAVAFGALLLSLIRRNR